MLVAEILAKAPPTARVVFMSGNFNVIHPGHLRIINFAAECGDFLVVGVNADGEGNALLPERLRCEGVRALSAVGYAFILNEPVELLIQRLKPAVVVKGDEYRTQKNIEKEAVERYGGKLLFCSGGAHYSSLDLLREELESGRASKMRTSNGYLERHLFSQDDLASVVKQFASLRVVVLGDLIVDEYIDCEPLGMSREDPTLVVSPMLSTKFVGGAGIVAAHARGLGAQVKYLGVVGCDEAARFAENQLSQYRVDCWFAADETRPTSLKQRFRAENRTLLRVSHLRQHAISDELIDELMEQVEAVLEDADLVIFSDFNYGCLPQRLVDQVSAICETRGVSMIADSQTSSQVGDISRFRGMTLVTPTEHEARLAMRDNQSGLVVLAENLRKTINAQHVVMTLASEGILIHSPLGAGPLSDDRLPAFNTAPRDVSGAGDCLLTATALALTCGVDIWKSAYIGSLAAACQVRRIGNIPLAAADLFTELAR